jgi:hypothetical protein
VCNPRRRRYAYRRRRRSSTCVAGNGPEHRRSTSSWLSRSHSQADFRTKLTLSYTDVDENPSLRYRRRGHKRDTPTLAVEHTCSVPPTPPAPRTSRTLARGTVASSVASEISGIVVDRRRGSADQLSTWEQREHGVRGRTSVEAYCVLCDLPLLRRPPAPAVCTLHAHCMLGKSLRPQTLRLSRATTCQCTRVTTEHVSILVFSYTFPHSYPLLPTA